MAVLPLNLRKMEPVDLRRNDSDSMRLIALTLVMLASATAGRAWAEDVAAKPSPTAKPAPEAAEHFEKQVKPILLGRCLECHGSSKEGGLDLRLRTTALAGGDSGEVLVAGEPDESLLLELVTAGEMPPNEPLSETEVAALRKWIADGAYYGEKPLDPLAETTDARAGYDWWSLQPIREVEPPPVEASPLKTTPHHVAWGKNPIDRFVIAKMQEKKLSPSPPASPRVLIRRASYDLTGLPPTPEEVDAFVAACRQETGHDGEVGDATYAALVDRLLGSKHYGEQWGRHWLDVVRFGESTGFEQNHIITNAWPFRDYVIRSFNEDKPFDQLTREHLAGDMIDGENLDVTVGTAFLVCGPYDTVGNQDPLKAKQIRANTIDEIVRATGETFLGLTVGCGRCHDHKFDPISQQDYYQLYSAFSGVVHGSRAVGSNAEHQKYYREKTALDKIRADLRVKQKQFVNDVVARAETKAAEYEAQWPRDPVSQQYTEEKFAPVEARYVRLVSQRVDTNVYFSTGYRLDEFEIWTDEEQPRNVALATAGGEAIGSSRVAEDFMGAYDAGLTIDGDYNAWWVAESPTLTIKLAKPERISRVSFSSDRPNAVGSQGRSGFPCEYKIEVSSDGETWTEVAHGRDRKPANGKHRHMRLYLAERTSDESTLIATHDAIIADIDKRIGKLKMPTRWWVGYFKAPPEKINVFLGGDVQRLGKEVMPASLNVLANVSPYELPGDTREGDRRLALAEWLVAKDNPLTPRVLVNRLWHYHFGTGIVATPSDFGFMGDRPSHPELLDWLAGKLLADGWRIKPLHREIMLSHTYRQSSDYREEAAMVDADARLLWRYPPRRLAAEEIRDTILSVTGKLDKRMGGPGYRLYRYLRDNVATYVPLDKHPPETYRRGVYHHNSRAAPVDLVTDFDGPDCAFSAPRRSATISPLQSLTLMNHSFTLDMADALVERLQKESPESAAAQVRHAYRLAYGREPAEEEVSAATALIDEHGLRAFSRALLNSSELIYVD